MQIFKKMQKENLCWKYKLLSLSEEAQICIVNLLQQYKEIS